VYANPWIRVREDSVLRPDGAPSIYGVVEFEPAVGVVALDGDGSVYLVGQYRYPTDGYSWEIVTGYADAGEDILEAAKRELREEAGLEAADWQPLGHVEISNSVTDQVGFLFLGTGLTAVAAAPDGTEQLEVRCLPLREAVAAAQSGAIFDGFSLAGLYRAWHYLEGDLPTGT
jgi:8-oxo-dGTP pyrophosphatase MutT (NUDIX family)